ncbi:MAG TPA: hypothetical protein VFQ35_16415 [Polyangiaceae bacterium]|nr:hypothetical protein [Polyangiaceae bacterium]
MVAALEPAISAPAAAAPAGALDAETAAPRVEAWTEASPEVLSDLRAGRPLVTVLQVPLCSNRQIRCGGQGAGDPASLDKNLYWGRGFGVRRYFDETARGWRLIARSEPGGTTLEQRVYARDFDGSSFGLPSGHTVRHLVVMRAVNGDAIESAVDSFYELATRGGRVRFEEDGQARDERVHVAGYAGHNRLMDGYRLKEAAVDSASSLPSFVIACRSSQYFSSALAAHGSTTLVMTRDLVAPEGYVIEALANALGRNSSPREIRAQVVRAYARWQKLSENVASTIFAR